jgi:putative restriction endonuclease
MKGNSTSRWEELAGSLKVWKKGDEVAPHKPLLTLMLLARAQRGESNVVAFDEVEQPLARLLREFGPPRRSVHPEHPFWYLETDGFWHVHDRDSFLEPGKRRQGSQSPTKTALRHYHAVGEVPDLLWKQVQRDRALLARVARMLLDQFWPESVHDSLLQALGLDLDSVTSVRRRRDPTFREEVLRAYQRRCAVCGYDARLGDSLFGLDAAHIHWHQYSGPDVVQNGLALCSLHHVAFDRGAFTLSDGLHVLVSQDVTGTGPVQQAIIERHDRPILEPQASAMLPSMTHVQWHRKNVFREPSREGACSAR